MNYLRRIHIRKDSQLSATIFYIHKNPVHRGLVKEISAWKWSSYSVHLSKEPTIPEKEEELGWFGNTIEFIKFHNQPIQLKYLPEME